MEKREEELKDIDRRYFQILGMVVHLQKIILKTEYWRTGEWEVTTEEITKYCDRIVNELEL